MATVAAIAGAFIALCERPLAAVAAGEAPAPVAPQTREQPDRDWVRDVYERSVDSVVMIDAGARMGTGFCTFAPEYILTALHVVDDAPAIRVESTRGHRRTAQVVTYSEAYDLALLRLERPFERMVPLEAERDVRVGEGVAVIGHPLAQLARSDRRLRGLLAWSLSDGIVGAVSGSWLQTNAALNPGTSGGPVLNQSGHVIGLVSARLSDAQNIGMISRIHRAEELLTDLGRGAPPRRVAKLDKVELGVALQWGEDTVSGIAAGAGLRVFDDFLLRARLALLNGTAEPESATVLTSQLTRVLLEAVAGYAVTLPGRITLSGELGVAVARDRREDSSLRAEAEPSCAAPPCLVAGEVIRSSNVRWPVWPMLGATGEWGFLRLGYALQIGSPAQHRVIAAFAF